MTRTPKPARRIARGILKTLGRALEQDRAARGLTKTAFSREIGVSVQCYCDWLDGKGDPSLFTIIDVSYRLGWDECFLHTLFKHGSDPLARTGSPLAARP
ncbi:helix-turn-helix transcriptional regulator (plasmid) [Agrobacterium rosae]|uniref:Helix-turn-helix transcriptional regulator n=1 Tax=Agrobacterium rosae TaxID=1972867 RepID=A0ABU4W263_9HYPH|nr:helix-turn-helix transcriptional regulator [Agrobacterium rosae]MDX8331868.1 helix-turn-helix transcriptional regulator [Agrobacterium rosae]